MLVVLDNAESILDPPGADARAIGHLVEELSPFPNICLIITLSEFVAPLRFYSSMTTSLTMRTLASNKPSQHAVNDVYCLGRAVRLQATVFRRQRFRILPPLLLVTLGPSSSNAPRSLWS